MSINSYLLVLTLIVLLDHVSLGVIASPSIVPHHMVSADLLSYLSFTHDITHMVIV